jgi:hypothetical protein
VLAGLEGDKLALLIDHIQQVSGLNAERGDQLQRMCSEANLSCT